MAAVITIGDVPELTAMLLGGLSADERVRQPAESALALWKERPGYLSALAAVIVQPATPLEARWLGACCFKNDIRRSWRRNQRQLAGGITAEEKAHLRGQLVPMVEQSVGVEQVAKQVAEIVAQVARFEFPAGWPELLPALVERLDAYARAGSDGLGGVRAVMRTLHAVLKQLATKRLRADRLAFASLSAQLLPTLHAVWRAQGDTLVSGAAEVQAATVDVIKYCTKSLRLLLVNGLPDFHEVPEAVQFVGALSRRLQDFLDLCLRLAAAAADAAAAGVAERVHKCALSMASTLVELIKELPRACWACGVVRPCLDLCRAIVALARPDMEELRVLAMHFVIHVLAVEPDNAVLSLSDGGPIEAAAKETSRATAEFFSAPVVTEFVRLVVGQLLPLTTQEMETWAEEPERFLQVRVQSIGHARNNM